MARRDWLLLLIGDGLDPIRIQKGMFLFAMESAAPPDEKYSFEPYNWGPFAQPIYGDLMSLQVRGLVERIPVAGANYYSYRRTETGNAKAAELEGKAQEGLLASLREARADVSTTGFEALLRKVYKRYPQYATKSLFQRS